MARKKVHLLINESPQVIPEETNEPIHPISFTTAESCVKTVRRLPKPKNKQLFRRRNAEWKF